MKNTIIFVLIFIILALTGFFTMHKVKMDKEKKEQEEAKAQPVNEQAQANPTATPEKCLCEQKPAQEVIKPELKGLGRAVVIA